MTEFEPYVAEPRNPPRPSKGRPALVAAVLVALAIVAAGLSLSRAQPGGADAPQLAPPPADAPALEAPGPPGQGGG
jgi:hypothetical protein